MTQAIPGSIRKRRPAVGLLAVVALLMATFFIAGQSPGNANAQTSVPLHQSNVVHPGAAAADKCPTPPSGEEGWYGWHFVLPANANFESLSVTFASAGTISADPFPGSFVSTPDASHAYIWTPTADTLQSGTATTDADPAPAFFNLSGTCAPQGAVSPSEPGTITIVKQGLLGTDTAHFTEDITSAGSFDLSPADNSVTFNDVAPGTYHVTEAAMAGYTLTGMGCALDNSRAAPSLATPQGNTLGITLSEGQSLTCTFVNAATQTAQVQVNISKTVDGAAPTGDASFDFTATWSADNLGDGSGPFTLDSSNNWMTSTVALDAGADYSIVENGIDATCDEGDTYRLLGYSIGDTAEAAAAAAPVASAAFSDLQANQYVIVRNAACAAGTQHTVTISKVVDGVAPTGDASFDFTATWSADNLGDGSGPFTLDSSNNWTTSTVALDAGADYSIVENGIDATCDEGDTYRLAGYGIGATAEAAAADTTLDPTASLTDLQSDQFIVVHNVTCAATQQYTVTVSKMVDDAAPTEGSFDLTSTWTAANLNGGVEASGNFTLDSSNSWMATTALMDAGASYSVVENNIDDTCDPGDAYRLDGYSIGDTAEADAGGTVVDAASITDLQSDQFIVVHNVTCPAVAQYTVTVSKMVDDAAPTEGSFDLTSTWTAANLNGGVEASGNFTLDSSNSWMATTALMDAGASYSVVENNIDATCEPGDEYRLAGYSVGDTAEAAAGGTVVDDASITDLQSNQFIVVHNVTCPIANSSITITKEGLSGDAVASFTHDLPGQTSDTFELTAEDNSITFDNLPAGTYHFTELPMEGWNLVSTGCSFTPPSLAPTTETGNILTVVLGENEDQTCTFTNEQITSNVTVVKYVDGAPATDGSFTLTETRGDSSDTSEVVLDSSDTFQYVSGDIPFGTSYSLSEEGIDGTCDAGDQYRLAGYSVGATLDEALAATPTETLDIASLEADTYVVVWNQDCANIASITIVKDFNPDAAAGVEASFTVEGTGLTDFSIGEGAENGRTFENLNAGSYTFTEDQLDGWTIQSIFCSGQSSPSNVLINLGGASATVTLNPGDQVTCTFTNMATETPPPPTGNGTITIHKTWNPSGGPDAVFTTSTNLRQEGDTFTLTDDGRGTDMMQWTDLAADTYTFTETSLDGWTLSAINCTGIAPESIDVDLTAGTLGIDLGEDEDVDCTFTNTQDTNAVSPFFPPVEIPSVTFPSAPAPSAVSPSTPPDTNVPSSNIPSTNNPTTNTNSPSVVSPAPVTNDTGTVPNISVAPNTNTSAVGGGSFAATPVAPSTGNGAANSGATGSALWLGLGLAALAGIAGVTAYGATRKR